MMDVTAPQSMKGWPGVLHLNLSQRAQAAVAGGDADGSGGGGVQAVVCGIGAFDGKTSSPGLSQLPAAPCVHEHYVQLKQVRTFVLIIDNNNTRGHVAMKDGGR